MPWVMIMIGFFFKNKKALQLQQRTEGKKVQKLGVPYLIMRKLAAAFFYLLLTCNIFLATYSKQHVTAVIFFSFQKAKHRAN